MGQKLDVDFPVRVETTHTLYDHGFRKRPLCGATSPASGSSAASAAEAHRQLPRHHRHFLKPDQKRACKGLLKRQNLDEFLALWQVYFMMKFIVLNVPVRQSINQIYSDETKSIPKLQWKRRGSVPVLSNYFRRKTCRA